MQNLEGTLRTYPWGSRTLLAQLRGTPSPSATPEAELWFGAHPAAPSLVGGVPLDAHIAAAPEAQLGSRVARNFDGQLPFLVKLLAAGEPLSIQAHPSAAQAREGFARENELGIALTDPRRNYKDPNPKPELIVALTQFRALAGFRPVAQTKALFEALGGLERYAAMCDEAYPDESLRAVFTSLISLPATLRATLLQDVAASARVLISVSGKTPTGTEPWMRDVAQTFIQLTERYPGDVGALAALLLNHVTLEPGEALYLDAGQLHAYLSGLGVEVMANSDNVLRGGLTAKHVDVPELVRVLSFKELAQPRAQAQSQHDDQRGDVVSYPLPIDTFVVSRHTLAPGQTLNVDSDGPAVVLCTAGKAASEQVSLLPGQAAWISAEDAAAEFQAEGAAAVELFYVRV